MDRGRRAMPVQNKACNQRFIQRCQERHKQKLRNMKCSIDNKPPRQAGHLKSKAKKNALIEDRISQIETENHILLRKMSHIMMNKGAIDNKNENIKYGHSLNKDRRKRELQRITKQNLQILNRIQGAMPTYNHKQWEKEAKENDKILSNISEFDKPSSNTKSGQIHTHLSSRGFFDKDILMKYEDCL
mmetsp:Transcript_13225/g.24833  ORF Transcript_13225/g.24833 Transcript_13225/m.24833 type:complete len:187 (+) Transcript_13225:155-715(+)